MKITVRAYLAAVVTSCCNNRSRFCVFSLQFVPIEYLLRLCSLCTAVGARFLYIARPGYYCTACEDKFRFERISFSSFLDLWAFYRSWLLFFCRTSNGTRTMECVRSGKTRLCLSLSPLLLLSLHFVVFTLYFGTLRWSISHLPGEKIDVRFRLFVLGVYAMYSSKIYVACRDESWKVFFSQGI